MSKVYLLSGLLLLLFASCKKANTVAPEKGTGKALTLNATELQQSAAGNAFNFDLFKIVSAGNTGNDNLFMSPLSVGFALGMTANGSNGNTFDGIRTAMGFTGFSQDQINSYYNKLLTDLPQLDPNTTLNIANSIWYRQGFNVLPAFIQADSGYYHAKISALDFNTSAAPATINNWVNTQTNGKIPTIVSDIPADVMMYLINAIYFKSSWKEKFDAANTYTDNFYRADNSIVKTKFMTGKIDFNSYSDGNNNIIELPYSNSRFSMVIVQPTGSNTLSNTIASLDAAKWQTWISGLKPVSNNLAIPKFTFSYNTSLKNALTILGMGNAFSGDADLTKIAAGGGLQITDVKHKAFISVDEAGTEAAAVTSVIISLTSIQETYINHPFIFAIREMNTGLILFTGLVNDPTSAGN